MGREKRKREKILLEKQTLTSTIRPIYRLVRYREATVCGVVSIATVALQRERGGDTLFIRKDYNKWKKLK